MNRPPKLIFAAALFAISLSLTAQSKLEDLLKERESLLASYEQASPLVQASIKSKLSKLEAEIRAIDPTALDPKTNPVVRPAPPGWFCAWGCASRAGREGGNDLGALHSAGTVSVFVLLLPSHLSDSRPLYPQHLNY